jgi:hypothetical protein
MANATEQTENLHSTYLMFPNDEKLVKGTPFYDKPSMNIFDYLNLIFYAGGAMFFLYYFIDTMDSFGYCIFIFSILVFCEIMGG